MQARPERSTPRGLVSLFFLADADDLDEHVMQVMSDDTLCWWPPLGGWCGGISEVQAGNFGRQYVPGVHLLALLTHM